MSSRQNWLPCCGLALTCASRCIRSLSTCAWTEPWSELRSESRKRVRSRWSRWRLLESDLPPCYVLLRSACCACCACFRSGLAVLRVGVKGHGGMAAGPGPVPGSPGPGFDCLRSRECPEALLGKPCAFDDQGLCTRVHLELPRSVPAPRGSDCQRHDGPRSFLDHLPKLADLLLHGPAGGLGLLHAAPRCGEALRGHRPAQERPAAHGSLRRELQHREHRGHNRDEDEDRNGD